MMQVNPETRQGQAAPQEFSCGKFKPRQHFPKREIRRRGRRLRGLRYAARAKYEIASLALAMTSAGMTIYMIKRYE